MGNFGGEGGWVGRGGRYHGAFVDERANCFEHHFENRRGIQKNYLVQPFRHRVAK
jgi:hypothetical protein